jgi:pimeloyl-ACP methyl ester carboxylesterase
MDEQDRSQLTLADGRTLAWTEYGDRAGTAVLNHHGGLLSGSDVAPLDDAAQAAGVRLVSFDRPGIGGSSPAAGRTVLDGAADAQALLDHLGIDAARLLGWSMGGQYALATAFHLGERIRRTAIVAGCLPLDDPGALAELDEMDQRLTSMAEEHVHRVRAAATAWGGLARFAPRAWATAASRGEPDADVAAVRANRELLSDSARGSAAQGDGWVEEYRAWVRPWGFALRDVETPVDVWQGTEDHLVPAVWAERMGIELPSATVHMLEGEGHFLLLNGAPEVFAALTE